MDMIIHSALRAKSEIMPSEIDRDMLLCFISDPWLNEYIL